MAANKLGHNVAISKRRETHLQRVQKINTPGVKGCLCRAADWFWKSGFLLRNKTELISFVSTTLLDQFKRLAPLFYPISSWQFETRLLQGRKWRKIGNYGKMDCRLMKERRHKYISVSNLTERRNVSVSNCCMNNHAWQTYQIKSHLSKRGMNRLNSITFCSLIC